VRDVLKSDFEPKRYYWKNRGVIYLDVGVLNGIVANSEILLTCSATYNAIMTRMKGR
jgi:hypothetical protein